MKLLAAIGLIWLGWMLGWRHAHLAVATECERLGGFYVGATVYRCTAIEPEKQEVKDGAHE